MLMFVAIGVSPEIVRYYNTTYIFPDNDFNKLVELIPSDSNLEFKDNKLIGDKNLSIELSGFVIRFGNSKIENGYEIIFLENDIHYYTAGIRVKTVKYSDIGLSNVKFLDAKTNHQYYNSLHMNFDNSTNKLLRPNDLLYILSLYMSYLVRALVVLLVFYFLSNIVKLYSRYESFKLAFYALTWYFIGCYIFSYTLNPMFRFIGIGISLLFYLKSLTYREVKIKDGKIQG